MWVGGMILVSIFQLLVDLGEFLLSDGRKEGMIKGKTLYR